MSAGEWALIIACLNTVSVIMLSTAVCMGARVNQRIIKHLNSRESMTAVGDRCARKGSATR